VVKVVGFDGQRVVVVGGWIVIGMGSDGRRSK